MLKYLEDQSVGIMSEKLLSQTIGILSIIVVGHIEYLTSEKKFIRHFNSQKKAGRMGCRANRKLEN